MLSQAFGRDCLDPVYIILRPSVLLSTSLAPTGVTLPTKSYSLVEGIEGLLFAICEFMVVYKNLISRIEVDECCFRLK